MSRKRQLKEKADKTGVEDAASKSIVSNATIPAPTFGEYQCSGNVAIDFSSLCALVNMKNIPAVKTEPPASPYPDAEGEKTEDGETKMDAAHNLFMPCLRVELANEDPLSVKSLKISGWGVDEQIVRVLVKLLPSLSTLQNLEFWQARLTDPMVISLVNGISLCSSLRVVVLEGNPLPEHSYHLLLSEESLIGKISLRNNRIGDEGARLMGAALSTPRSASKNLWSLNLAFNWIGDAGAAHIAQGLRLNRALLILSLSNNRIGDSGAASLATILGEFALTHEEVVERRKLLLERQSCSSLKGYVNQHPDHLPTVASSSALGKSTSKKREPSKKDDKPVTKSTKKSAAPQIKSSKLGLGQKPTQEQDSSSTSFSEAETVEIVHPLLDKSVQCRDGNVFLPGNTRLVSLNLSGNRITEEPLSLFLSSLQKQGEGPGLLRLCLQRNRIPPESEPYVKIKELMTLRDPLNKDRGKTGEMGAKG